MNPNEQIGAYIKKLRKEKNMTQAQISELAKVNVSQISKMENGCEDVSIIKIGQVFRALGCPARLVLYENPSPSNDPFWDNPEAMRGLMKAKTEIDKMRGVPTTEDYGDRLLSIDL